jgi:small-conductance mechanosensitive channel
MSVPLQVDYGQTVDETIAEIINFTPRLVGALLVLLIGWVLGRLLYRIISRTVDRIELDELVLKTPLGRVLGGSEQAISHSFGKLGAWFVYALAVLTAANVLAVDVLSEWITEAVSYLPALVAGALIIVVGFVLADFLADVIARTESLTDTGYTDVFADGVRVFLYFIAIVIGLDTIGVDVQILHTFSQAAAFGLAAGIALAIGIAFGWGGKDYVAENIGSWMSRDSGSGESSEFAPSQAGDDS